MSTEQDEAHAWLAFTQEKDDKAIILMRGVADKQDIEGKRSAVVRGRPVMSDPDGLF